MYRIYQPFPYYRRYYDISPYHYWRYYIPHNNYQQNVIDSQISDVDQNITNYGNMSDVIQDTNVYQLMSKNQENLETNTNNDGSIVVQVD